MDRTSVIAITQFVFLALGSMALRVLMSAQALREEPLDLFLAKNCWWLLLIPVAWALYANIAGRVNRGPLRLDIAQVAGCVLAGVIALVFAYAILVSRR